MKSIQIIEGRKIRIYFLQTKIMNSFQKLFSQKNKNILSIYFTAGFPELNDTNVILKSLEKHGADIIEIGMPYSDPLADGPVIQNSGMTALHNGMTIKLLFEQLKNNKEKVNVPLILMGYLNPVLQYGFEKFCVDAKTAGVSGIILPDLPITEFQTEYKNILEQNNLNFIFLITPETSEERIIKIDDISNGFIYAVSSSSITGRDQDMNAQKEYFERIKNMNLRNNVLIGFGIKDHQTFTEACRYASGAIIGTAYIKAIENGGNIDAETQKFLNSILQSQIAQ
jgi:tryptophan synthase alpha chain